MTNQEAIEVIKEECYVLNMLNLDRTRAINMALDKAIEALESQINKDKEAEQKGVLDKLETEQNTLRATCKAWQEAIDKNGYVN